MVGLFSEPDGKVEESLASTTELRTPQLSSRAGPLNQSRDGSDQQQSPQQMVNGSKDQTDLGEDGLIANRQRTRKLEYLAS